MSKVLVVAGLELAEIVDSPFSLHKGVHIESTYAHLIKPYMLAFEKPESEKVHHPAPWRAIPGGDGTDITAQIVVTDECDLLKKVSADQLVWLIASLIRVSDKPDINIAIKANTLIPNLKQTEVPYVVVPFELQKRNLMRADRDRMTIGSEHLLWISEKLENATSLLLNGKYRTLLDAFDFATFSRNSAASMIAIWGSLEHIFVDGTSEVTYKLAVGLSSFLHESSADRRKTFERIKTLYKERSAAAHRNAEINPELLKESLVLLATVVLSITENGKVPTTKEVESMFFGPDAIEK